MDRVYIMYYSSISMHRVAPFYPSPLEMIYMGDGCPDLQCLDAGFFFTDNEIKWVPKCKRHLEA